MGACECMCTGVRIGVCVQVCVCRYVYVCVRGSVRVYERVSMCTGVCMCLCAFTGVCVCECMCTGVYGCVSVRVCTGVCVRVRVCRSNILNLFTATGLMAVPHCAWLTVRGAPLKAQLFLQSEQQATAALFSSRPGAGRLCQCAVTCTPRGSTAGEASRGAGGGLNSLTQRAFSVQRQS